MDWFPTCRVSSWVVSSENSKMGKFFTLGTFSRAIKINSILQWSMGRIYYNDLRFDCGKCIDFFTFHESLEMSIYDDKVILKLRNEETILNKKDILLVFLDKKQLVLLGNDEKEIFRYKQELKENTVRTAFLQHHYSWSDKEPFKEDFQKWVEDSPDVSPAANALLKARKIAIENGEDEEVFQLAKELWKLRVSVKENDNRQYYR